MPPYNCTLVIQNPEGIQVECVEGFDGGLQQIFLLEVYELPLFTVTIF